MTEENIPKQRLEEIDNEIAVLETVLKDATMSEEEIAIASSKIAELKLEADDIWNQLTSMDTDGPPSPEALAAEPFSGLIEIGSIDADEYLNPPDVSGLPKSQEGRILTENEKKVEKIEALLAEKYKEFIAKDPGDTEPFAPFRNTGRPPFQLSIIDNKFVLIDMLTIDPNKQGQYAGSAIIGELVQWADENDMHVIASPVNERVEDGMKKVGAKYIKTMGYYYFGWKIDEVTKLANEHFASAYPLVAEQMNNYIKEIQELEDEVFNLLVEASGEDGGALALKIREGKVNNPQDLLAFVQNQEGLFLNQSLPWNTNTPAELLSLHQPGLQSNSNLTVQDLGYAQTFDEVYETMGLAARTSMDFWLTSSLAGERFVLSLMSRFDNSPNTQYDVNGLRKALNDEIWELTNYKLDDNTQRQFNAGRAIEYAEELGYGRYADISDGVGLSEEVTKFLHMTIYDNDARKRIVNTLNPVTGINPHGSLNSTAPMSMTANSEGNMTFYRAMSEIDASLGLRSMNVLDRDLSAKGFGRNSYFTTSANYANAYVGRTGSVPGAIYEVQLNINDLSHGAGSIINLAHPIGFYPELIYYINEKAGSKVIDINNKGDRFRSIELTFANQDFIPDGREGLDRITKILHNDFGFELIINRHTGPGGGIQRGYLDATGFTEQAVIHPGWARGNPMPVDEVIFIATDRLRDKVQITNKVTDIGTGVPKTVAVKPLEEVVQNLINKAFEDFRRYELADEGTGAMVVKNLNDVISELRHELGNRPEETRLANTELLENLETIKNNALAIMNENGGHQLATAEQLAKGVDYRDVNSVVKKTTQGIWDPRNERYVTLDEIVSQGFDHRNTFINESYVNHNGVVAKRMLMIDNNNIEFIPQPKVIPVITNEGLSDNIGYYSNYELAWVPEDRYEKFLRRYNQDRINMIEEGQPLLQTPITGKDTGRLSHEFKTLLNRPNSILEFNITHASPFHNISINDIQGGYDPMVPVVDRTTGDVTFKITPDRRNQDYLIGLSTSFEDDIIFNKYSQITGKSIPNYNVAKNYFTIRINSSNVYTLSDMQFNWLDKYSINNAAKAMDVPPNIIIEAFMEAKLIQPDMSGNGFLEILSSDTGVHTFFYKFKEATKIIAKYKTNSFDPTISKLDVTRLMRGGGIEALIENPNANFHNFEELMLLDPNDQAGVGSAIEIIDIDEATYNLNRDNYKLITPGEAENNPLRNYEDIDTNLKQTSIDEAYDIRINFETGFSTAEREALGLKGDLPEFVANSVLNDNDARKLIEVGEAIITAPEAIPLATSAATTLDLFTLHQNAYNNLANMTALTEVEYHYVRGMLDKDGKALVKDATGPGGSIDSIVKPNVQAQVDEALSRITPALIDDSAKWKLVQGARNKLAYSAGLRGAAPTGLILLDLYEIALWGSALAYGTSDAWSAEFENIVKGVSNQVFGTAYTMDTPGEIDYEKLNSSLLFAEKASPTEWVLGPIIDDYKSIKYANSPGEGNTADDNREVIETLAGIKSIEPTDVLAPVQIGDTEVYVTGRQIGPPNPLSDGEISQGEGIGTRFSRYFDYQRFLRNKQFYNRNNEDKPNYYKADMFTTNLYNTDNPSDYWRSDY